MYKICEGGGTKTMDRKMKSFQWKGEQEFSFRIEKKFQLDWLRKLKKERSIVKILEVL